MFNIGMGEILIFSIIALIILGPEKLPVALRTAAKYYVRIKKFITNIQHDIEKQLNISELREQMQHELKRIETLEQDMHERFAALERQHQALLQQTELTKPETNAEHSKHLLSYLSFYPVEASNRSLHLPFTDAKVKAIRNSSINMHATQDLMQQLGEVDSKNIEILKDEIGIHTSKTISLEKSIAQDHHLYLNDHDQQNAKLKVAV